MHKNDKTGIHWNKSKLYTIWQTHPILYSKILSYSIHRSCCRNPNLRLATKGRACEGAGQEGSSRITFHALGSVSECEGMNPHTPKWAPISGVGVLMDFRIFREQLYRSKPIGLRSSLYHWKVLGTWRSKMGSHDPFGHLTHKL
jgi:hypothetical protein